MELSIIIPAFDEEENLAPHIEDILSLVRRENWSHELIIVDDHSSDHTGEIADNLVKEHACICVIHRRGGDRGMGFALKEATDTARGELIFWTMADRADDLEIFPEIIRQLKKGHDMVIASRYMRGGSRGNLNAVKAFFSFAYSFVARIIFGLPVHDITNAFRGFRKEIFGTVRVESGDFAISPEFAIKAYLGGFKLGEVPVTYQDRMAGRSKFKLLRMGLKFLALYRYRFVSW